MSHFGVYFVSAYWTQDADGLTPGDSIDGFMQILSDNIDLQVRATGIANLSGNAECQGSVSGIISTGGTIQFVLNSSGALSGDAPLFIGFTVIRVSS